jgi:hypothetical protein
MIGSLNRARSRASRSLFGFAAVPLLLMGAAGMSPSDRSPAPPATDDSSPPTEAPHKAGPQEWAPTLAAAPPPGVTATASATCNAGSASLAGYPAGENHTAFLTLYYGDATVRTTATFQQTWNGSLPRPAAWPSDAVWWVAVTADDAQGEAFAAARVPPSCLKPRAPQLFGTAGPGSASLQWFQPATVPVTDYVIEHSLNGTSWETVPDAVSTAQTHTVTNLTNNVNHWFRVAAVGANGTGDFSNVTIIRPTPVPTAPRRVSAAAGPLSVVVRWQAPASGAPTFYRIEYSTDRQTWNVRGALSPPAPIRITGLTKGVRYFVRVSGVNGAGTGSPSAVVSAVAGAASRPLAPTNVTLTRAQTDGDAFVGVFPDYDGGRTIIKASVRCVSSNGGATRTGTATGLFPTNVLVAGLTKLKTYRCTGTLTNRAGTSPAKTGTAFVMPVAPAAPTGVTVSVAPGNVRVNFRKLTGPNPISGYQATCTSSNGGQTGFGSIPSSAAPTIPIFGLTPGKRYTCRVTAFNLVGLGAASRASAAFTAP